MAASAVKNKSFTPRPLAELLPGLRGILSEDAIDVLTAKKQSRATMSQVRTAGKVIRPLTMAEISAGLSSLKKRSPRTIPQNLASTKKRQWNSSVKVDKKISHTAEGQLKHNPVRKVLNFQPKTKPVLNSRPTMNADTPKFPKPDYRPKKHLYNPSQNNVRISGVYNISQTPVLNKPHPNRPQAKKITQANKENNSNAANLRKKVITPKPLICKNFKPPVPDTPLSNESWKSSCDASFLQNEKDIQDIEDKTNGLLEENILQNIAEVSPPASTPFKEYRNVNKCFNNSSMDSSVLYNDNTIMTFDKTSTSPIQNSYKPDESVIVSLCDMLNKATVNTSEQPGTELNDLLEIEKKTENHIKIIENSIKTLNNVKESQLKLLAYVQKSIKDKQNPVLHVTSNNITEKSPVHCSVIKSPIYKIPKKTCLRKKVFHKSMPNVASSLQTPKKEVSSKAIDMYLNMKENMHFLNTPVVKQRTNQVPDTPAVTSHNLQKQLHNLFLS